ncbi:AMP-binding protein, partial [Streptomyces griseofuscus]|uniref:AMP-binding protein n=1 Tax=Streptomyces griseofuscus TaxID=146922 RepID=UPI00369D8DE1
SVVLDAESRVSEFVLVDGVELERVLVEWNATDMGGGGELVSSLFESAVVGCGAGVAVVDGSAGVELSYAEFGGRVFRLARYLRGLGVGPECVVMVAVPSSVEQLVCVWAVLVAGGVYLPVDLGHPDERLASLVVDSGAVLVLAGAGSGSRVGGFAGGVSVVDVDDAGVSGVVAGLSGEPLGDVGVRGDHAAYVIYTSGSTGRPKGVVVEHRALSNYVAWARSVYRSVPGLGLVHSSAAFDMSVTALFVPLVSGGRVELVSLLEGQVPAGGRVDWLKVTPSHVGLMEQLPERVSSVGELVVGGEQLSSGMLERWRELSPGVRVVNEYGPTEATVGCVAFVVEPGAVVEGGVVPIGRPIWNMRAYVLDGGLCPVGVGMVGELYVSG